MTDTSDGKDLETAQPNTEIAGDSGSHPAPEVDEAAALDALIADIAGSKPAPTPDKPTETTEVEPEGSESVEDEEDEDDEPPATEDFAALKARLDKVVKQRNHARKTAKRLKDKAEYAEQLQSLLDKHGVKPEQFDGYIAKGAEVGFDLNKLVPAPKAEEPKRPDTADNGLDADLQQMVDDYEIHIDVARKIQKTRKSALAPTPPARPESQASAPAVPRMAKSDVDIGNEALRALNARYEKKLGAKVWNETVAPEVNTRMKDFAGLVPSKWGTVTEKLIREVIAEKGLINTTQPTTNQLLRTNTKPNSAVPQRKKFATTEAELAQEIAEALRGR